MTEHEDLPACSTDKAEAWLVEAMLKRHFLILFFFGQHMAPTSCCYATFVLCNALSFACAIFPEACPHATSV